MTTPNNPNKEIYKILSSIIKDDFPQYFVEIGAHDGKSLSNSINFIKKGWKAISIEANPFVFKKLKKNLQKYSNVKPINIACSTKEGKDFLYIGTDGKLGMYSTLCEDNNSWFNFSRSNKKISVKVSTLETILNKLKYPSDFSILLIDTEGMDFEVLEGMNFKKYKPRIIITEEYLHNQKKHEKKYQLLKKNGYLLKHKIGCNTIWVNKHYSDQESIFNHIKELDKNLKESLSKISKLPLNFKKILKEINPQKFKITLIKNPKWKDDALLFKVEPVSKNVNYQWTIKIHEDKYPLASHIYDTKEFLNRISCSGFASKIIKTSIVKNKKIQFRVVMYEYLDGESLSDLIPKSTNKEILLLRKALKKCVKSLLLGGRVFAFVRDLDDYFVIKEKKDKYRICLTDYNAILDCSNSNKYSRENVLTIIDYVIDNLVTKDYEPYIAKRPTMADLRS